MRKIKLEKLRKALMKMKQQRNANEVGKLTERNKHLINAKKRLNKRTKRSIN